MDFGAESHSTNIVWPNGRAATARDYQLLFGPEFTFHKNPKVTPFVHGLAGMAVRSYTVPNGSWTCTDFSCPENTFSIATETGFAAALGGGTDWHVRPILSVRVGQFD